jgi:hypothetical protein
MAEDPALLSSTVEGGIQTRLKFDLGAGAKQLRRFRADKHVQVNSRVECAKQSAFGSVHADAELRQGPL